MSIDATPTSRALRLSRWYPKSWRDRYGDEFADHLEQEISDTPRNPARTFNIIRKGLATRLSENGLAGATVNPENQFRVSASLSLFMTGLFALLALDLWSNGLPLGGLVDSHRSFVDYVVFGADTFAVLAMVALIAVFLAVQLTSSLRHALHSDGRSLRVPLALAIASLAGIVVSVISWSQKWGFWHENFFGQPGLALNRIEHGVQEIFFQSTYVLFEGGFNRGNIGQDGLWRLVLWALLPLFLLVLVFSLAWLVRRSTYTDRSKKALRLVVISMSVASLVFLISIFVALALGEQFQDGAFFPEPWSGGVPTEFGLMVALVAVAAIGLKSATIIRRNVRNLQPSVTE